MTLDEFFNAVEIRSARVSPDGHAVAIETARVVAVSRRWGRVAGAVDAVEA
jgi:hypothetical protein